jgi:hypothetical protein
VNGYSQTVDPSGRFFVDLRYPGYTYDKLVCGLIDAYSYAEDQAALQVLYATTDAARPHMPERALNREEQNTRPHKDETYTWDETYTMAENLFLAYARTGDGCSSIWASVIYWTRRFLIPYPKARMCFLACTPTAM